MVSTARRLRSLSVDGTPAGSAATRTDVTVIGAGILGLATARELMAQRPGLTVTILEKEDRPAQHQTGHNSGVVHAGLYYTPGSLKAQLCTEGRGLLKEFCDRHGVKYDECGKLVVALDEGERAGLAEIHRRSVANGVPGIERRDGPGLRELEPHVAGVEAVWSPATAIVDFPGVCEALATEIAAAGGTLRCGVEVAGITDRGDGVELRVRAAGGASETLHTGALVICAGLHGDRLARLAGGSAGPRIVPFRGEYYALAPDQRHLVNGLIYPVPDPRYPFLGIHLTRHIDGEVLVGATPCWRWPARATGGVTCGAATCGRRSLQGVLGAGQGQLAQRGRRDAPVAEQAAVRGRGAALRPGPAARRRDPGQGRRARPGAGRGRLAGRRLRDRAVGPGDGGAQRAVTGRHVVAGHRPLRRAEGPAALVPALAVRAGPALARAAAGRAARLRPAPTTSSRRTRLRTLPAAFRGRGASASIHRLGTLKPARRSLRNASRVVGGDAVPGWGRPRRPPPRPAARGGAPKTAASWTPGCSYSAASTSAQYTFSPPRRMMSFSRSWT